jgi:hypothetical protein
MSIASVEKYTKRMQEYFLKSQIVITGRNKMQHTKILNAFISSKLNRVKINY